MFRYQKTYGRTPCENATVHFGSGVEEKLLLMLQVLEKVNLLNKFSIGIVF